MLNAFRHHGLYRDGRLCLTPGRRTGGCSTPFGITDYIGARTISFGRARCRLCSTPFGITDYIGVLKRHDLLDVAMCSTPFGITDYIGLRRRSRSIPTEEEVLNAFRHHGLYRGGVDCNTAVVMSLCSTPFGITDYIGCGRSLVLVRRHPCVLNAFRHHGLYRGARCSARRRVKWHVLNAFRHHGLYRAGISGDSVPSFPSVLNAFRHHGLYRVSYARIQEFGLQCSTPFGITDYIGAHWAWSEAHQDYMCSTPFGITDYIGSATGQSTGRSTPGAQRLSASRIISGGLIVSAEDARSAECSTPFGITDYIGSIWLIASFRRPKWSPNMAPSVFSDTPRSAPSSSSVKTCIFIRYLIARISQHRVCPQPP